MTSNYKHKDESVKLLLNDQGEVVGLMRVARHGNMKVEMLKCEPMNMDEITDIIGSMRAVDVPVPNPAETVVKATNGLLASYDKKYPGAIHHAPLSEELSTQ